MINIFSKDRWSVRVYGISILFALELDDILKQLAPLGDSTQISVHDTSHAKSFEKLQQDGMIESFRSTHDSQEYHSITYRGKLKIAEGGYTGEIKKSKNVLYSFFISIIAIILSIASILLSIFYK